jgi:hypothetical protein
MTDDATLGGYLRVHDRPPAFTGSDGAAYSAEVYVDVEPDDKGLYGGAVLFVRWSESGDRPVGHLETAYLSHGSTPEEAAAAIRALSLLEVKARLDEAIAQSQERPAW